MMGAQFENVNGTDLNLEEIEVGDLAATAPYYDGADEYKKTAVQVQIANADSEGAQTYYFLADGNYDESTGIGTPSWVDEDGFYANPTVAAGIGYWFRNPLSAQPLVQTAANLDEEFVKSLEQEIAIDPKDSPRVVALKMTVQSVRNEIAELRKNGDTRSVGQILADHIALNNHRADLQGQALAQVEQVRRESGDEAAAEYLEKVNAILKTYGVEPIGKGRRRGKREEVRE